MTKHKPLTEKDVDELKDRFDDIAAQIEQEGRGGNKPQIPKSPDDGAVRKPRPL